MSSDSRRVAAILLVVFPTVVFGGASLLTMLIDSGSGYTDNELRQDLWRAGHAHAGVLLVLSLVLLRYVDEAVLSPRVKSLLSVMLATINEIAGTGPAMTCFTHKMRYSCGSLAWLTWPSFSRSAAGCPASPAF